MSREWVDDAKLLPKDKRWVMRCDRYTDGKRCPTQSEPFVQQPPLASFAALGWFIAEKWGDICPTCLAAGYHPKSAPYRFVVTPQSTPVL